MTDNDQSDVFARAVLTRQETTTSEVSKSPPITITVNDGIINKKHRHKASGIPEIMQICGACCLCAIIIIALIGGAIAYLVFGILVLVNDKDISDACSSLHIWAYVLTSLILMYTVKANLYKSYISNSNDKDAKIGIFISSAICCVIIDLGLAIWGSLELNALSNIENVTITNAKYVACTDLENSNIKTFSVVTMTLQYIAVGLAFMCMTLISCSVVS